MGGKTGEWGEGPAGATVPYHVRGLHAARGANWTAPRGDNAQKLKNKTRAAAIPFFRSCHGPSALGSGRTLAPPARKVKSVPLARSMPILGAARGAHGEQHDLEVGRAVAIAPLGSARPTKHVLLHLKGCAAAHATRAAHLTSSSPAPSGAPVRTRHRTTRAASRDPKPFVRWSVGVRIGTGWRWWSMTAPGTGRSCARPRPPENSPPVCASARDGARRRGGVGATRRGRSSWTFGLPRTRRARRTSRPAVSACL